MATWDRMYRTNLRSAAASSRAALALFGSAGGAIVNLGAAAARAAGVGMAAYAASKAGVSILTESPAEEVRGLGIRVNAVLPTIIDTPANRAEMPDVDRSRWLSPQSVVEVVAFSSRRGTRDLRSQHSSDVGGFARDFVQPPSMIEPPGGR